jgi:N-acetyl-gamma-glutamyl-phosphate reductase common form
MSSRKIKVGIYGGTGYMGGEALRVLLQHPQVEVAWVTSRSGGDIAFYHPNLYGVKVNLVKPEEAAPCDAVFLGLPTGESMDAAADFLKKGCKVIDLGAAFRLKRREVFESVYKMKHSQWEAAQEAVYGIPELHPGEVAPARLIANPGCFASAAILGLTPLVKNSLIDLDKIVVDGLSGTAGVGAEQSRAAHHPEIGDNLVPYNVVDHRHTYEMEQELAHQVKKRVTVHFTPTYVPIVRGILCICHGYYNDSLSRNDLLDLYRKFYEGQPFIRVYDLPKEEKASWQYRPYPWVSSVAGTNYCFIGLDIDEKRKRVVVFSVLDNLGKGGAQAGVENMNLMFGFERTAGLTQLGRHP